ncbi:NACHT and WD repeat domain-containing protein [Nocardia neocaledoniensis]|uniref:NACHT and WD repeat domain-containing protein n=1 Tax=Nocardia neocaledoniensis TaxID=236511 RepID=UPI0024555260|nr:NACHT and WD repeat domain-containing protein [Nocardia neocaledoniensis]
MTITDPQSASPRAVFAQRFAELYAAAGNPTLRRVAAATERRMRGTQAGTPSPQRISDWKAGRNVPARFESLLPVVLTLVDLTEKAQRELPRRLADPHEWRKLWQESVTWTATATDGDTCPYPGLRAFRADERALFFGREQATTEFVDLVRAATGIVVLIGASGAGKSSLLAAGLRPALDLPSATITPGAAPLAALAAVDTAEPRVLIVDQFEELFTLCDDEAERTSFLTALADLTTRAADPLTVVLALRADFYERCLHHPVLRDSLRRNHYLLGPMSMEEVSRAITGPATAAGLTLEQGLEELVLSELRGLGAHADTDAYDPGSLPLLSHVMAATWQQREGRKLTVAGYRKAGGVAGSVAETAELAWSELTPVQQEAAQDLLGSLVTVGQDARDTRRTAGRTELLSRSADPDATAQALEVLAASRLVALDADSVQFTHEIVLTAWPRLRGWIATDRVGHLVRQRLETDATEWEAAARDPALLYRGTRLDSATEHARGTTSPRSRAFLDASRRSARLGKRWRVGAALVVVALLGTGVVAWDRGKLADQRTADRDYAELVAAAQRTRAGDPSLSAQLSLAAYRMRPDESTLTQLLNTQELPLAGSIVGHDQRISELVGRSGDGMLASIGYDEKAFFWDTSDPARPRRLGGEFPAPIDHLAFVPHSTDAVTDGPSGVQLWDLARPESPRLLHTLGVENQHGIAVAGDGTRLVAVSTDALTLWRIGDRDRPTHAATIALSGDRSRQLHRVAVSPDGNLLALGRTQLEVDDADTVEFWDIGDPGAPRRIGPAKTTSGNTRLRDLAFSPVGRTLALATYGSTEATTGQSSRIELWNVADPRDPRRVGAPWYADNDVLNSIAFNEAGTILASGSNGAGQLWNIADPNQPVQLAPTMSISPVPCPYYVMSPCKAGPQSVDFLSGRGLVAGAGDDGALRMWSLPRSVVDIVAGLPKTPVFDRTGNRMVVLYATGTMVVWDTTDPARPVRLSTIPGTTDLADAALSPDGRTLSVHDRASSQRLVYALDDPRSPRALPAWPARGTAQSVVGNNRMAVTYGTTVQLWDIGDRLAPVRLGRPIDAEHGNITRAQLSPDGKRMELISFDMDDLPQPYLRQVWNLDDPRGPARVGGVAPDPAGAFQTSVYLPDDNSSVVADFDHFRLWRQTEASLEPLTESISTEIAPIVSASAADGLLATVSDDGTTLLWDTTDPRAPRRASGPIGPADGRNRRAILHPGGGHLVVLTDNGQLGVWDLVPERVADRICAATGDLLTQQVWERQLPNVPYRPPCS